jgi:uncharacterized membrane protein YkgB
MTNNSNYIDDENPDWKKIEKSGILFVRYGLVIILLWIGLLKFTSYEAMGIMGFVANSPFMSWAYTITNVRIWADVIGAIEICLGILIAIYPIAPRASEFGSWGAVAMGLCTFSFLYTTPGVLQPGHGFPFLSPMPGQFLIKDLLLIGTGVLTAGRAHKAWHSSNSDSVDFATQSYEPTV